MAKTKIVAASKNDTGKCSESRDATKGGTNDKASVATLTKAKDQRESSNETTTAKKSRIQIATMIGFAFLEEIMGSVSSCYKIPGASSYMFPMSLTDLRVASYNIRKARGLDNKRMPERTLEVINGLNADIVVLQEADKRLGARTPAIPRRLIEAETDLDLVEVAPNGISLGWHGNAMLVRSDLRVAEIERLTLPGFEPRGAVRVSLDIAGGLCVVATHLGLRRRDRQLQLEALLRATQNSKHAIVAGDFNEWSESKGLDPLRRRFEVHTPGRSFHARRPLAALDRLAVTTDIKVCSGGVDDRRLARRASDHLPIWANIRVQPRSVTC